MTHSFTSLRHPLEKLKEAEYFLGGLVAATGLNFQFNLNAFLSACRSTTFVLQKAMSGAAGFESWYRTQQRAMKNDAAMRFFLELRNISQHEGPVSYIGGSMLGTRQWTYRFAGNRETVPSVLRATDIGAACADQTVKLAHVLLDCFHTFPFASCPVLAISLEGMAALGYQLADVGQELGLPRGYLDVGSNIPMAEKLRILATEFEPLDVAALERIGAGQLERDEEPISFLRSCGNDLTDTMAEMIEQRGQNCDKRNVFVTAVAKRIIGLDK